MVKFFAAVVLLCLSSMSAYAICVSQTVQTADQFCIDLGGGQGCELYANLANGSVAKKAAELEERLQARIDFKQALNSLPLDDPDRAIDPDAAGIFWSDLDGKKTALLPLSQTFLTSRCADVSVIPDDLSLGGFQVTISNP